MASILFLDVRNGTLTRLSYLRWYILLMAVSLLMPVGLGAGIGITERMTDGNLAHARALITQHVGVVGLTGILCVFFILAFAFVNISAKRIRDMGLPGWWIILVTFFLGMVLSSLGEQVSSLWSLVTTLALLLIPGNAFRKTAK